MINFEKKIILNPVLTLIVPSAERLSELLRSLKIKQQLKSRYIAIASNNSEVLIRMFSYRNASVKEIESDLISEAADLLSTPAEEIEIDYQVLYSDDEKVEGIFACVPSKIVRQYLLEVDNAHLTPVKLIPAVLAAVDFFVAQKGALEGRCCIIDVSQKDLFNFAVLEDKRCQFLRKVKYSSDHELQKFVVQTMQSACAESRQKSFDYVFLLGSKEGDSSLANEIKQAFDVEPERIAFETEKGFILKDSFFELNLLKNYVFSPKTRTTVMLASYFVAWLLLLQSIFLVIEIRYTEIMIQFKRMSFTDAEYNYALKLKEKLK